MPLVTAFNLRKEDPLPKIEQAVRHAMASVPALGINVMVVLGTDFLLTAGIILEMIFAV